MAHLYAITAALSGTTDLTVIAETLADQTLTAFGATRGAVVLRSEDGSSLETVAWRGHKTTVIERWRSFPLDASSPIGDAVLRNEPVVMVDRDDWLSRYDGLAREEIPAAAASIPLDVGDRAIGGLTLSFDEPREFTSDDIGFMLGAARQGAQALERARSEAVRRLAEERLSLLARAGGLLAESLDYPRTLAAVVDLVVPRFADWATVEILEPSGAIRSLAVAHVDPEKVALAKEFRAKRPPDLSAPSGVGHVIATGEPEMVPEITEEMIAAIGDPEVVELVRELQLRSAMIVPLSARGQDPRCDDVRLGGVREHLYVRRSRPRPDPRGAGGARHRQRPPLPRSRPHRPDAPTQPAPARPPVDRRDRPGRQIPPGR